MQALLLAIFIAFSISVQAKTFASTTESVSVAQVDQVIQLVNKRDPGSSQKKVSILVVDHGMSSDVSPRYSIYLGFASLAEMGNFSTQVKVTNQAFQFISASRKSAGVYEIKAVEYRDQDGLVEVTHLIDANQMFLDEQRLRKQCVEHFCDEYFKSSVFIKESVRKIQ